MWQTGGGHGDAVNMKEDNALSFLARLPHRAHRRHSRASPHITGIRLGKTVAIRRICCVYRVSR